MSKILLLTGRKTVAADTDLTIIDQDALSNKAVEGVLVVSHLEDGGAGSHRRLTIFFNDTEILNPSGVDGGGSGVQYGDAPWKIPLLIPPDTKLKVVFRITSAMVGPSEGVCGMFIGEEIEEQIKGLPAIRAGRSAPSENQTGVTT